MSVICRHLKMEPLKKKSTKSARGNFFGIKRWYDNYLSNKVNYKVIPITKGKKISMKLSKLAKFRFWSGINSGPGPRTDPCGRLSVAAYSFNKLKYMLHKKLSVMIQEQMWMYVCTMLVSTKNRVQLARPTWQKYMEKLAKNPWKWPNIYDFFLIIFYFRHFFMDI